MNRKFLIFFLIFNFFLNVFIFAQDKNLSGVELSDYIFNALSEKKYNPVKQELVRSDKDNFPYNILLTFGSSTGFILPETKSYDTIVFVFEQEDLIYSLDYLYDFIQYNLETDFDIEVRILLTTGDKKNLPGNDQMSGSYAYTELLEGSQSIVAVPITFDSKKTNSITPGSQGKVCPLWLIKLVYSSLEKNGFYPSIKGEFFMSLYKLNVLRPSSILASFLSKDIPAVELNMKVSTFVNNNFSLFLKDFLKAFNDAQNFENDIHYLPLKIGSHYYWLSEKITLGLIIFVILISLAIICDLSFIFRKKHSLKNIITKRAFRSFYIIPFIIFISTFTLEIGELICYLIFKNTFFNHLLVLGLKLTVSLVLTSLAFILEIKLKRHSEDFIYEYYLSISCLLNIFIFSAIEISLFYLFALIYLIIFVSRFFKKNLMLYFFMLLSVAPYFFIIYEISLYSSREQISEMIYLSPLKNMFLSFALTPFSIMILRILSSINKNASQEKRTAKFLTQIEQIKFAKQIKKRFPKYYLIIEVSMLAFIALSIGASTLLIRNSVRSKIDLNTQVQIIETTSSNLLDASYYDSNYYGGTIRRVSIYSEKKAERIEVFVSGQTSNPIYYTTFTYSESDRPNQVKFNLPDNPPDNFSISYTPDNSSKSTIDIFAYYSEDDYPEKLSKNQNIRRQKIYIKEKKSIEIDLNLLQEN